MLVAKRRLLGWEASRTHARSLGSRRSMSCHTEEPPTRPLQRVQLPPCHLRETREGSAGRRSRPRLQGQSSVVAGRGEAQDPCEPRVASSASTRENFEVSVQPNRGQVMGTHDRGKCTGNILENTQPSHYPKKNKTLFWPIQWLTQIALAGTRWGSQEDSTAPPSRADGRNTCPPFSQ